jgi:hypothetical protein
VSDHAEPDGRDRENGQDRDDDHLADVEPGAGCTEIWEHLSERREAAADTEEE